MQGNQFSGQAQSCSKILNVKNILNTVKIFRANSIYRASTSCLKILKVKGIFNTVKNFRATLFFQGKHKLLKIVNGKKIFNAVCIHMGVICVIWASVVCNLDQRRD